MPRKAASEQLVFFVDRSLGGKLVAEALRSAGAEVVAHDDVFDQNATDVEWLAEAGRRRWVVLTKDSAIRRHAYEKAMFREAACRVFLLASGNMAGTDMAAAFVGALPRMRDLAVSTKAPFLFGLTKSGKINRLD